LARKVRQKLGEILIEWGLVTKEKVDAAYASARGRGQRLGEALVEAGACKDEDIAKALAHQFGVAFLNLDRLEDMNKVDKSLMPADLVKKYLVLPMAGGGKLKLVIHDPMDLDTLELLRFRIGDYEQAGIASRRQIEAYIKGDKADRPAQTYVTESMDKSIDKSIDKSEKSLDRGASIDVDDDGPIIKLTSKIIIDAVNSRASDIHIEPGEADIRLRFRIDGACQEITRIPKKLQNGVLSRFKLMAGVNIAEKRIPQDGRTRRSTCSTRRTARSSPPRTRSNTTSTASTRCRSASTSG
jgi:type IV pilus assembly protein PilB